MKTSDMQLFSETLEKGLGILHLFDEDHQCLTLTEISRALGINQTSIFRYLNTYCKLGYLRKDPHKKQFMLGPPVVALAQGFILGSDLVDLVKPVVDKTFSRLQVSIDVSLLHGDSMYCIYRRENKDTLKFRRTAHTRGLHFLATGKAALAFLPEKEQLELIEKLELEKKTKKTIVNKSNLIEELRKTRERGYSFNNEEYIPGLIGIGAPLINLHASRVQGGMCFMSSVSRYTMREFKRRYAEIVVELAKEISSLLPFS